MALRKALQRSLSSYSTIGQGLSRSFHNSAKVSSELESFASCSSSDLDFADPQAQPLVRKPANSSSEVNFVKFEIQQLHVNISITNNFNTFPKAESSKQKSDTHVEHTIESPKPKK